MTREELWAKYQAGGSLSAIEEQDLAAGLCDDPDFRERFIRDFEIDGLLRVRERSRRDAEDFERAFFRAWDAEHSATRFLKKVESRIRDSEPQDRAPKPPTRRPRFRPQAPGQWPSAFPLVAGVVFAFIAIFVMWRMVSTAQAPSTVIRPRTAPVPETPIELPAPPVPAPRLEEARRQDDDGLRAVVSRIREEVRASQPAEPAPPPPVVAPDPPRPVAQTRVQVATIDLVGGPVTILSGDRKTPAKPGAAVTTSDGLDIAPSAYASILYPDGTRVDLAPGTRVGDFGDGIRLDRGTIAAQVAKQKAGQSFVVRTPQGEVRVVGTVLRVLADGRRTRLEVEEGRVELKNSAGKTVMVEAAHGASTTDLVSKPLQKTLFADTFESSPRNQWPKGWVKAPTPDNASRSNYVVIEEGGKHYMGCIGTIPPSTQHAAVPWDDWGAVGRIEMKLRAAGPRNQRAGLLLGGAVGDVFLEYDATAGAVKVEDGKKVFQQVPFKAPPGAWMDWSITVERLKLRLSIDRKPVLDVDLKDCGPLQGALLVSRGEDSAHFDDFKLLRR